MIRIKILSSYGLLSCGFLIVGSANVMTSLCTCMYIFIKSSLHVYYYKKFSASTKMCPASMILTFEPGFFLLDLCEEGTISQLRMTDAAGTHILRA